MAKDFDFQILAIYAMCYELTVQITSTITSSHFTHYAQLRSWACTIFHKIRKSVNSTNS